MALVAPEACQHAKSMLGAPTELICGCLGPFLSGVGTVSGFGVYGVSFMGNHNTSVCTLIFFYIF